MRPQCDRIWATHFFFSISGQYVKECHIFGTSLPSGATSHPAARKFKISRGYVLVNVENRKKLSFKNLLDIRSREDDPILEGLN